MKRREAFTLIELLVLIAVETVVGAVLSASLSDAKQKVQSATCMNNLREISLALRLYTDDHNGFMPVASADLVTWPKRLRLYLPQRGTNITSKANLVFVCPSANYSGFQNQDLGLTYSCTGAMLGPNPPAGDVAPGSTTGLTASQPRKQSQVYTNPSQTPLIIEGKKNPASASPSCQSNTPWILDASIDLAQTDPAFCYNLDFRHNAAMNIAFFDGSVRSVSFAQAKATFTRSLWEGR